MNKLTVRDVDGAAVTIYVKGLFRKRFYVIAPAVGLVELPYIPYKESL